MKIDHLRSNGHLAQVERQPKGVDYPRLLALGYELLLAIGEDPEREFIDYDPGTTETTFSSVTSDQLVCVRHTGRLAL